MNITIISACNNEYAKGFFVISPEVLSIIVGTIVWTVVIDCLLKNICGYIWSRGYMLWFVRIFLIILFINDGS